MIAWRKLQAGLSGKGRVKDAADVIQRIPNNVTIPVASITTSNLVDSAVTNAKISSVSVSKLTAGTLSYAGTLGSGGSVRTDAGNVMLNNTGISFQTDVATQRYNRVIGTTYRNTSSFLRIVSATIYDLADGNGHIARIGLTDPPGSVVSNVVVSDTAYAEAHSMSFPVPNNWYYGVYAQGAAGTVWAWAEVDIY